MLIRQKRIIRNILADNAYQIEKSDSILQKKEKMLQLLVIRKKQKTLGIKAGWNMRRKAREIIFDVDAYTVRLLGRENRPRLGLAVAEIIKNAYDADAEAVCIYSSDEDKCVYIMDNGTGMTEEMIRSYWMRIGKSPKKHFYMSEKHRIQNGKYGIGRFAFDRISDQCEMLTIANMGGLECSVDWRDFDGRKRISDAGIRLYDLDDSLMEYVGLEYWKNRQMADLVRELSFQGTGTAFRLTGLHDVWDSKLTERLRKDLEALIAADMPGDFRIFFFDDQTKTNEAEITRHRVEAFDYKIDFQVRDLELKVQLLRNEFDFQGQEERILKEAGFSEKEYRYFQGEKKHRTYSLSQIGEAGNLIGDFSGTLYFGKSGVLENEMKTFYLKNTDGRPEFSKKYGGIRLYRDYFRIYPYGENGDCHFDWLDLYTRKERFPAGLGDQVSCWRVDPNEITGFVHISRNNSNLEDTPNRNGLQEGEGLEQLKHILLSVIRELEQDRQLAGRKLWDYAHRAGAYDSAQELWELRIENRMLRAYAGAGMMAGMFLKQAGQLLRLAQPKPDAEGVNGNVEMIKSSIGGECGMDLFETYVCSWATASMRSLQAVDIRRKNYVIAELVKDFMQAWEMLLLQNGIELCISCDGTITFTCDQIELENVLSNLFICSMLSLKGDQTKEAAQKKLYLMIEKEETGILISCRDNGSGLPVKMQPCTELLRNASANKDSEDKAEKAAFALWILSRIVSGYNGSMDLNTDLEQKSGFQAVIRLKEPD